MPPKTSINGDTLNCQELVDLQAQGTAISYRQLTNTPLRELQGFAEHLSVPTTNLKVKKDYILAICRALGVELPPKLARRRLKSIHLQPSPLPTMARH
eukprot:m.22335 g.22335  ORF g.22335 m.22335 type:complete len:98 (+) comp11233_c0_seq1:60-353(+)